MYFANCAALMGVGSEGQGKEGPCPTWIFIHGTNIVDRGLKVLYFGLFLLFFDLFSVGPPLENFLPTPLAALAAVLFTTLIENLRLCSSIEAGLFLFVLIFCAKMSLVFL